MFKMGTYMDFEGTGELYVKKTTLQFQGLGSFLSEQSPVYIS